LIDTPNTLVQVRELNRMRQCLGVAITLTHHLSGYLRWNNYRKSFGCTSHIRFICPEAF